VRGATCRTRLGVIYKKYMRQTTQELITGFVGPLVDFLFNGEPVFVLFYGQRGKSKSPKSAEFGFSVASFQGEARAVGRRGLRSFDGSTMRVMKALSLILTG
jgi:hypothetical protein